MFLVTPEHFRIIFEKYFANRLQKIGDYMRKIIVLFAIAGLMGAVHAQKKKAKTVPKPVINTEATKADAEAKAKAAQDSANAKAADLQNKANEKVASATNVDESKMAISIWGGYGISGKSDYLSARETIFNNLSGATNLGVDTKNGGIAGGADFFYGTTFQIGLSAAYLKGHDVTRSLTFDEGSGPVAYKVTAKMDYSPILVSGRYFLMPGLYAGAGVGIASILDGSEKVTPNINLANGTPYNVTFSGSAIAIQGRVGYDFSLTPNISLGVAGILTYLTAEVEGGIMQSNNDLVLKKFTHNFINFVPAVALTFKF